MFIARSDNDRCGANGEETEHLTMYPTTGCPDAQLHFPSACPSAPEPDTTRVDLMQLRNIAFALCYYSDAHHLLRLKYKRNVHIVMVVRRRGQL